MYCIYCGREVPEGQECRCRNAGTGNQPSGGNGNYGAPYAEPSGQGMPYGPGSSYGSGPSYGQGQSYGQGAPYGQGPSYNPGPVYGQNVMEMTPRHKAVKKILGSGFMAVIAALYTAGCVAGGDWGVLNILMIVAMWITFAAASRKNGSVKTAGMSIMSGVYVARIVLQSLAFLGCSVVLAILLFNPVLISKPYGFLVKYINLYFDIDMPVEIAFTGFVTGTIIAVWVCMFIFTIFYLNSLRHSASALKFNVTQAHPSCNVSIFAAVVLMLDALLGLASLSMLIIHMGDINGFITAILNHYDVNVKFRMGLNYFDVAGIVVKNIACILGSVMLFRLHGAIKKAGEN